MEVLAFLAAGAGEVRTRAEIMAAVWPDTYVGEDPLNRAISELRKRLGDDARSPRYIETIPRRGYRLVAPVTREPETSASPAAGRRPRPLLLAAAAALVVALALVAVLAERSRTAVGRHAAPAAAPARVLPVTTFPGREVAPALSPDGSRVAFSWAGPGAEAGAPLDLYLTQPGAARPLRLVHDGASEISPAWFPDGTAVAFVRQEAGRPCRVAAVPAIGGAPRTLYTCMGESAPGIDVSPDGRTLLVADAPRAERADRLYLVSLETGERRALTDPAADAPGGLGDTSGRFSADGRWVAFRRNEGAARYGLYVVATAGGPARPLSTGGDDLGGLDWSADGSSLIVSSNRSGIFGLWRIPVTGGPPVWLGYEGAYRPSVVGDRMVVEKRTGRVGLWRVELAAGDGLAPSRWLESTRTAIEPAVSPDGARVAFVSERSGSYELWVADADGGEPTRLTSFGAPAPAWRPSVSHPRWSPDGRSIVVAAQRSDFDLYLVPAAGGVARRITSDPGDDLAPCWSDDGRALVFVSSRGGRWGLWRFDLAGGVERRLAATVPAGPSTALECPPGGPLYLRDGAEPRVLRLTPEGSGRLEVLPIPVPFTGPDWTATAEGLYGMVSGAAGGERLAFRPADARRPGWERALEWPPGPRRVAGGRALARAGLAVSPDGGWALLPGLDEDESDLVLVEGVR